MLVLTLHEAKREGIRIETPAGPVVITLAGVRGSKVRLGLDAPPVVKLQRIDLDTGESLSPARVLACHCPTPSSDGVAEATLACTGAEPARSNDAPAPAVVPLVARGQGAYARPTYGRDVLQQTAVGGLINAIV